MKKNGIILIVGLIFFAVKLNAQMSGSYTINQDSATSASNFNSIQEAADSLSAHGVNGHVYLTIVKGTGPYYERVKFSSITGASDTSTITFDGNGEVIKFDWTSTNQKHTMWLAGVRYCTIKNFYFEQEWGGWGIRLGGISAYNTIEHNIFNFRFGNVWSGIGILSSNCTSGYGFNCRVSTSYNTIRNNKIYGAEIGVFMSGGYLSYSNGNVIENNIIEDCDRYGIYMGGQRNSIVSNNDVSRPNRWTVSQFSGIHFYYYSDVNNIVSGNRIHNSHGGAANRTGSAYGIYLEHNQAIASSPVLIYNNLIYDFNTIDSTCGIYLEPSDHIKVFNNTVAFENESNDIGSAYGFYAQFYYNQVGVELKNNVFYINRGGSNPQYGIYFNKSISLSNHNNIFVTGSGSGTKYIGVSDTLFATNLSQWQSFYGLGQDTNSVSVNPLFRDPERGLFHINKDSSQNIGVPYLSNLDFYNHLRDTLNPDPGAIESDLIFNDLGLLGVYQGNATCSGKYPLEVILKNYGHDSIYYAQTFWQINNGAIDSAYITPNLSLYQSDTLLLDSIYLLDTTIVKVWVGRVNLTSDEVHQNDTIVSLPLLTKMAGNYTINKNKAASQRNYLSFKDFVDDLEFLGLCGPVYVSVDSSGLIYIERVVIHEIEGSSAVNTITINGNQNTLLFTTTSTEKSVIKIQGTDYLTIENLIIEISSASSEGFGIHISDDAHFNTIRKCTLNITNESNASNDFLGIVCSLDESTWVSPTSVNNLTLEENLINGGSLGITVFGSQYDRIQNLKIIKNTVLDNRYSIRLAQVDGALVDQNDISRPNATNSGKLHGIELFTGCQNTMVSNNVIHHSNSLNPPGSTSNWVRAISIETGANFPTAGNENYIYNNLIYKFNSNRSDIWGVCQLNSGGSRISHNTIVLDQLTVNPGIQYGIQLWFSANSNVKITNNNIYLGNLGSNGIGVSLNGPISECDNNNIFLDSTTIAGNFNYGYISNTPYHSLSNWQTANSGAYGQSSTDLHPQFRDRLAFNMIPTNNALLGTCPRMVDIPFDIKSRPRDSTLTEPGAYLFDYYDDAGITEILDSGFSCLGKLPLKVIIKNYAIDTLKVVTINWDVNGFHNDSLITGINLAPSDSFIITLDTVLLDSAKQVYVWSSLPNGVLDERSANDSVYQYFNSRMSGYYTIEKNTAQTKTNYNTISSFADDINARGICGPVVVDIITNSGPYSEKAEFNTIFGSSPTNTILIKGNGNQISSVSSATNAHTLRFHNTSYIQVDSLNVSNVGTNTVFGIRISGNAESLSFNGCTVQTNTGSQLTYHSPIALFDDSTIFPSSISKHNISIQNCNIQGGNYGVFSGALNDSLLRIKNNEIYNFKLKGVALMSVHGGEISSNNIHRKGLAFNNSFHGIDLYQCSDLKVLKNRIHNSHDNASPSALSKDAEGIHISTCFSGAGNEILVANNLIYRLNNKGLTNGIHIDSSSNVQVYYNTISLDENLISDGDVSGIKVSATGNSSDFKNNIISIERGGNSSITGININGISPFPAMDYNDVYINAYGSGTFNFGRINSTDYSSLSSWKTALGGTVGQNSQEEAPGYDTQNEHFIPSNVSIDGMASPIALITDDLADSTRHSTSPDPGSYEFDPLSNDLSMYGIIMSEISICGDSNQLIRVVVKNNGLNREDSIPVLVVIQKSTTYDTLNYSIDSLLSGQLDTITMGSLNTFAGGNYQFLSIVHKASDVNHKNDSVVQSAIIHATPHNPIVSDTTICPGKNVNLVVVPIPWLYRWYLTSNSSTHFNQGPSYNLSPIYGDTTFFIQSVSITTGCSSERIAYNIDIDELKALFSYSITNKNNVSLNNQSSGLINSYLWDFGDSTTSTVVNPSHTYSKNGVYVILLTVNGVCDTAIFSDTLEIKHVGLETLNNNPRIGIQPNPNNGRFQVNLYHFIPENLSVTVLDLSGKLVHSAQYMSDGTTHQKVQMDLGKLSSGVYLLNLKSTHQSYQKKLIIR